MTSRSFMRDVMWFELCCFSNKLALVNVLNVKDLGDYKTNVKAFNIDLKLVFGRWYSIVVLKTINKI